MLVQRKTGKLMNVFSSNRQTEMIYFACIFCLCITTAACIFTVSFFTIKFLFLGV